MRVQLVSRLFFFISAPPAKSALAYSTFVRHAHDVPGGRLCRLRCTNVLNPFITTHLEIVTFECEQFLTKRNETSRRYKRACFQNDSYFNKLTINFSSVVRIVVILFHLFLALDIARFDELSRELF